jgi:hypothetical protein
MKWLVSLLKWLRLILAFIAFAFQGGRDNDRAPVTTDPAANPNWR